MKAFDLKRKLKSICRISLLLLVVATISLFVGSPVSAANSSSLSAGRLGAGVMIGSIDSFTGKYWLSNRDAIDFGAGFVFGPWTLLYADYLIHFPGLFGSANKFTKETSGYVGGGGGLGFWSQPGDCGHWSCGTAASGAGIIVRGLFGAEWYPTKPPIGVFAELGPSIVLIPGVGGAIDLGLGIRYYF